MKTLIAFYILLITQSSFGQMAVVDAGSNVKLTEQTLLQNAIKGYSYLQVQLQNSTLTQTAKTAGDVNNQLNLIDAALDVADKFQQSQMVKDFFSKQGVIISLINTVNNDLGNTSVVINSNMRQMITQLLNDAYVNAIKSLTIISNGFIKKQLNLSERMVFCQEATKYLSDALYKVQQSSSIINVAKGNSNNIANKSSLIRAIF